MSTNSAERPAPASDYVLSERELARRLAVSPSTVSSWRKRGTGPVYWKLGRGSRAVVRYSIGDVHHWLDERRRQGTRDLAPAEAPPK
jgi:predicted DNA-binding transcriptional regulator AlpA